MLLSRLRNTPRNTVIYLISRKKYRERISIYIGQSASLVRQLVPTKDEFPLQNHFDNIAAQFS